MTLRITAYLPLARVTHLRHASTKEHQQILIPVLDRGSPELVTDTGIGVNLRLTMTQLFPDFPNAVQSRIHVSLLKP